MGGYGLLQLPAGPGGLSGAAPGAPAGAGGWPSAFCLVSPFGPWASATPGPPAEVVVTHAGTYERPARAAVYERPVRAATYRRAT